MENSSNSNGNNANPVDADVQKNLNSESESVGDMDAGKKKSKIVVMALSGFCVVVIVLIVSIVLVNLNKDTNENKEEKEIVLTAPECVELDNSVVIGQCIQKIYDKDLDVDALIGNYGMAIKKSVEKEDYDTAVELISDRSMFLVTIGRCDKALKALDDVGSCSFDNASLFAIYNDAVGIGISCENEDVVNKYNGLIKELSFEEK